MVSLAAILSASSSAEASCPCSAASPALWWSLASSFVDDGVGRGGGSSVGFFVCLVVGFGVGYGRGSSVSMMGFPSASLSARSRVPPSKSQSDRMRSKASFEGPYVGVMVGWNAGEIFGIVVDGGGGGTPSKSNADQFSRGDGQGEGTSWPENRPGAEGPKLLGNSPGEEEAGVAVGMKSCYAHGMARNN